MVFKWKENARIKADANVAGAICEQLERTVGLSAKTLLDASREATAPLHNEFEWNDAVAAEEYRVGQARHIIACLCIERKDMQQETPVRAFHSLESNHFESIERIMRVESKRETLMEKAMDELKSFQRKYSSIREFKGLFAEIKRLEEIAG